MVRRDFKAFMRLLGAEAAMAQALARAGADIIGVSANLAEQGSHVQRAVTDAGRAFTAYRCDFADRAAVTALAEELCRLDRPVDILVNNAGTIARAPALEYSDELWDEVLTVDLSSQFVLTRRIGREMVARGIPLPTHGGDARGWRRLLEFRDKLRHGQQPEAILQIYRQTLEELKRGRRSSGAESSA
jgi:NAD(P)-dependent dehydrogenase (short-subunit alcohol dehydrogenase family)